MIDDTRIPGVVDQEAWAEFHHLVQKGAGACDELRNGLNADVVPSSVRDHAYIEGLVEHHRINTIPFLIEHCALSGQRVLEVGAGTAGLSVAMAQAGVGTVTGVEPIRLNYEAGLQRIRAYGLTDRIKLLHTPDTTSLPFDDDSFDACVCCSVLQYVPSPEDRRALLEEMTRVIRPGGLLSVCGSGNGLIPKGPHSTTWWSNLLPHRAAKEGHKRGVSYLELKRILSPLSMVRWRREEVSDGELGRWRRRLETRRIGQASPALGHKNRLILGGYSIYEATVCRFWDLPLGAFSPYVAVAFQKMS